MMMLLTEMNANVRNVKYRDGYYDYYEFYALQATAQESDTARDDGMILRVCIFFMGKLHNRDAHIIRRGDFCWVTHTHTSLYAIAHYFRRRSQIVWSRYLHEWLDILRISFLKVLAAQSMLEIVLWDLWKVGEVGKTAWGLSRKATL